MTNQSACRLIEFLLPPPSLSLLCCLARPARTSGEGDVMLAVAHTTAACKAKRSAWHSPRKSLLFLWFPGFCPNVFATEGLAWWGNFCRSLYPGGGEGRGGFVWPHSPSPRRSGRRDPQHIFLCGFFVSRGGGKLRNDARLFCFWVFF